MNEWQDRLAARLFPRAIQRRVSAVLAHTELAVRAVDDARDAPLLRAGQGERDRADADRTDLLRQALEAWRVNPLARRIVELTSQYVVGGGLSLTCKEEPAARFLNLFWNHRLNRMPVRCFEWCDELSRSGNLFVLISSDSSGMSYVRAVPAAHIARIESRPNDLEQPLYFFPCPTLEDAQPAPWPAYNPEQPPAPGGACMLHYAINRPVGAQWGEPDLAPLLRWLSRYANWLEDRARLNRFRTAFVYVVKGRFASDADRLNRQMQLNANPPTPGSILVADESESWEILSARLEAGEAGQDGLAIKKMIASGAGLPMHFLAEPEGATRTTAEAAGGPTYRRFQQRQEYFLWLMHDLLEAVLRIRAAADPQVNPLADFQVQGADLSGRDNISMAMAAGQIVNAFSALRSRGLIDDTELLRVAYRFAGETIDLEAMLARGRQAGGDPAGEAPAPIGQASAKILQPETGEPRPGW